jgi:trans-2,3-dihydro-3-hydroxyanthranilate isomerase
MNDMREAQHRFVFADVFTSKQYGGNQLAVFPWAENIPPAIMPKIARELNFSETVFVLPPDLPEHTAKLRIFTPQLELPFAGHPTIGTACVLTSMGIVCLEAGQASIVFEEGMGPVPVGVWQKDGRLSAQLRVPSLPEFGPEPPDATVLAQLLSIPVETIGDGNWNAMAVSCGVPFLFIPVRDRNVLARVSPNLTAWREVLSGFWSPHAYVITRDAELDGSMIRARMFAPAMGIMEDPAAGAAVAALAGYLWRQSAVPAKGLQCRVEQGFEMGRPSLIEMEVDLTAGAISVIRIAGGCVVVGQGEMNLGL